MKLNELVDFAGLKISLASPEIIRGWSHGEVTKPETINYRTLKPEKDGLFCERIFGPVKDWECYCGKYKRIRHKGIICEKCGVEVTLSRVRRERMGHITLATPTAHVWFFKGAPSKLSLLLDISPRELESVIYFSQYLVTHIDEEKRKAIIEDLAVQVKERKEALSKKTSEAIETLRKDYDTQKSDLKKRIKHKETLELAKTELDLKMKQKIASLNEDLAAESDRVDEVFKTIENLVKNLGKYSLVSEEEYLKLFEYNAAEFLTVDMGAEALLGALREINLDKLVADLREEISKTSGQRHIKATKRLKVAESLKKSGTRPDWMIMSVLPVIPPDLRPMVQLSGGRFATSDLNDLYRRVINRNNRLKHLIDLGAPEIILRNEKRMLQEAVDALIDSTQKPAGRRVTQVYRSLSDMLRGKQGRFRQNLLGKRVDYSGRSVIVVGPELDLNECGLPKEMALEMFRPFVLREIIFRGYAPNVKSAKTFLERRSGEVWDILEDITRNHPILLNRAPTLHKLGIQAFYPVLVEGNAIRLHPCVCSGFNADFDGDQMAVHVPLSAKAQEEARNYMTPTYNLLKPADGTPITFPNKEMVLGCYFLTTVDQEIPAKDTLFSDFDEAVTAYQNKSVDMRQLIKVRYNKEIIETTVGRIIFNELLPEALQFLNAEIDNKAVKQLVTYAFAKCGKEETVRVIDNIKRFGFGGATSSGLSVSVFDCKIYPDKPKVIAEAEEQIDVIEKNFRRGLITNEEKRRLSNRVWEETTEKIKDLTWKNLKPSDTIKIVIDSGGTRATKDQIKQLAGMRGLVNDPTGRVVDLPSKSNFRQGLSVFEYFTTSRGARKGLADKALKTADAGYLTRRLVDVAHDMIIREDDCGSTESIEIVRTDSARTATLSARLLGRYTAKKVTDPKTRKVLAKENVLLDEETVELIEESNVETVMVRSPLTCAAKYGLCAKCYGRDLSTKELITIGAPVGIIAAQSIGEPGTQLTMRTFHLGGIVGLDITQGLPRVEELFETRTPKSLAPISEIAGKVGVTEIAEGFTVRVKSVGVKPAEEREYFVPATSELKVKDGELITAGSPLATGHLDVKDILAVSGLRTAQRYIVDSVQQVYEQQGIAIGDKHIEVIVRKMSDKVRVESQGDTNLLPGEPVERTRFEDENAKALAAGGEPAVAQITMLGVTRASLYTESWLSAASFQETVSILTDAAIAGKVDRLIGMKENVIIGRLIPTTLERAVIRA